MASQSSPAVGGPTTICRGFIRRRACESSADSLHNSLPFKQLPFNAVNHDAAVTCGNGHIIIPADQRCGQLYLRLWSNLGAQRRPPGGRPDRAVGASHHLGQSVVAW